MTARSVQLIRGRGVRRRLLRGVGRGSAFGLLFLAAARETECGQTNANQNQRARPHGQILSPNPGALLP